MEDRRGTKQWPDGIVHPVFVQRRLDLKGQFTPKSKGEIVFLLSVVIFIYLDCFSASCLGSDMLAVKMSPST